MEAGAIPPTHAQEGQGDDSVVLDVGMHDVMGGHVESPAASREGGDSGGGGRGGFYWESGTGFGPFGWGEGWRGSLRGSFRELLNARTGFRLHVNAGAPGEDQSPSATEVARGRAPGASPLDDAEMGAATQNLPHQDEDAPSVPGQPQEGGGEGGQQAPIVVWAGRSSPFIIFFSSVLLLEHLESMCVLVIFNTLLWKCNAAMQRQALSRKVYELFGIMVLVFGELWFVSGSNHKLMGGRSMWEHLSLSKYEGSANFLDILWVVVVGDVLARQLSLAFKSLWLILMGNVVSQRSNFKLIGFQEALASFQRDFLPIPLWYAYLLSSPSDPPASALARAVYLGIKLSKLPHSTAAVLLSARALIFQQTPYGLYVDKGELEGDENGQCSICHDTFTDPVRTKCRHVFCEQCLSKWLQRDVTCPLCRCVVRSAAHVSRGDGTVTTLPVLF